MLLAMKPRMTRRARTKTEHLDLIFEFQLVAIRAFSMPFVVTLSLPSFDSFNNLHIPSAPA
jgi:hypothetical protein